MQLSYLSLYNFKTSSKLNIKWLLRMVIKYRVIRLNLYLMNDSINSSDVWLIKNCNKISLIPPIESELVI